jgi:protein-L-isoaspartate(D-aspartate) O-methyltransferase
VICRHPDSIVEANAVDRLQAHRDFFANFVTSGAGGAANHPRLSAAFASTPREKFVGPGPWKVFGAAGYVETPSDDPVFLYQDVTVAISSERGINNGQPTLHAICLAALNVKEGETLAHVGAGTGYYTAILAKLTGPSGPVVAYEIERDLAARATENLAGLPNVVVRWASGSKGQLRECDVIYVSAGATAPLDMWLDALRVDGRLLFPLTPGDTRGGTPGAGGMLLIKRAAIDRYEARFICQAVFISCVGARDDGMAAKLAAAFKRGDMRHVSSLRRNTPPDETCWCAGNGWWLSKADHH